MSSLAVRQQLHASQQIGGPGQVHGGPRGTSASVRRNLANHFNQVSPTSGLKATAALLGTDTAFPSIPSNHYPEKQPPCIPFIIQLLGAGSPCLGPGAGEGSRVEGWRR